MYEDKAQQQGLRFVIERADDVPECLVGDPKRLAQILINLVDNAIKFTAEGEVGLRVERVTADPERIRLAFRVRDSGPGIAVEDQARLFEPFAQVDSSLMRRHGGSGLGLAISRSLARMMEGEVQLISQPGVGSEFTLRGNFRAYAGQPVRAYPLTAFNAMPSAARVLLVEDDALNQQVAREFLEQIGATVTTACNGIAALEWLEKASFDLVLMDLQMPEMDGYEAVRRIRCNPAWQRLPIIAMTAHAITGERDKCLAAGMNDYLTKPVDPAHLAVVVDYWRHGVGSNPVECETTEAEAAPQAEGFDAQITARLRRLVEALGETRGKALLEQSQAYLSESKASLLEALIAANWDEAAAIAHSIKGGFSIYGSDELECVLNRVEARTDAPSASQALADELVRRLDSTSNAIEAWLAQREPL